MSEPDQDRNRHSLEEFNASYADQPPWDIGRPQPVFVAVADAGGLRGHVLDAGCGTGEHALMAAQRGFAATGVDQAPAAIEIAQRKARERGLDVRFTVWDALELGALGERYETVLDSGLFHVFSDEHRARYVQSLGEATAPGGRYGMLCFSDLQPGDWGPRRVSQGEIEASFADGWRIELLERVVFDTNLDSGQVQAWHAQIERVGR